MSRREDRAGQAAPSRHRSGGVHPNLQARARQPARPARTRQSQTRDRHGAPPHVRGRPTGRATMLVYWNVRRKLGRSTCPMLAVATNARRPCQGASPPSPHARGDRAPHRGLRADRRHADGGPRRQRRLDRLALPAALRFGGLLCGAAGHARARPLADRPGRARHRRAPLLSAGIAGARDGIHHRERRRPPRRLHAAAARRARSRPRHRRRRG